MLQPLMRQQPEDFQFFDDDYNKPLTETYLLGYYLQKNEMYKKKENKEIMEENDNE